MSFVLIFHVFDLFSSGTWFSPPLVMGSHSHRGQRSDSLTSIWLTDWNMTRNMIQIDPSTWNMR